MMSTGSLQTVVFASHNPSKIRECRDFFKPFQITIISGIDLNLPTVDETGQTFQDNALLKARAAHALTGKPVLADDSGLCVHGLNDEPGVFSARYAAEKGGYDAVFRLWQENPALQKDPSAHLICLLILLTSPDDYLFFEGRVAAKLTFDQTVPNPQCYDPILTPFLIDGTLAPKTFAQMTVYEKNQISHRGRAFLSLKNHLMTQPFCHG